MEIKFKLKSFCIITLLFSMIMSQKVIVAEEQQWQPVPEANYAEVLELIELRAKANYDEISSWHGRMNIHETNHYYGPNAAKMGDVDKDDFGRRSQQIFEETRSTAEFAVDPRNDRLCSKKEKPQVWLRALDLDPDKLLSKSGKYANVRVVLTPDLYVWYMPDFNFASALHHVQPQKTAFIDRPEERKFSLSGDIRDPREFFNSGGEGSKLWETLSKIRSDLDDRIKMRVAGYPHIEISSLDTDKGVKYRILTTWKGGEDYVIKYIRLLVEVDEAVGFNATKLESINPDGVRTDCREYTYEKIGEIYLPKAVKKEYSNNKGEPTSTSEITLQNTSLNSPLPEDTFTIKNLGLEEDTLVTNKIEQAEYRYSKGELIPLGRDN